MIATGMARLTIAAVVAWTAALPAVAVSAQTVKAIAKHDSWTIFADSAKGATICFAAGQPTKQIPSSAKRDPAYFYVTAWPKDKVAAEISVNVGYPLRKKSTVALTVQGKTFKLFPHGERAYVADAKEEAQLIAALKSGGEMTVKAISERGTHTTDVYPLAGLADALQALATSCR